MGERICSFDGLDLRDEQLDILNAVREFVDNEIIPVAHDLEASDTYPEEIVAGCARWACSGCASRGVRRPRARSDDLRARDRGALARLDVGRRHRQRRLHRERHAGRARHAGAEGPFPARDRGRRGALLLHDDRARGGLRRARDPHDRAPRRRRARDQRPEDVGHERRARRSHGPAREDRPDRRPAAGRHDGADRREGAGDRQAGRDHDPGGGAAEARLQGRRVDRGRVRGPPRAGIDDPRRPGGRGPGLLPDDERHRDRPHQRRRPRPRASRCAPTSSPSATPRSAPRSASRSPSTS